MKRRNFLNVMASASLFGFPNAQFFSLPDNVKKNVNIGLLLGSVEKYMIEDPEGTLKKIAALGYKEIEFPRTYGHSLHKLKEIINKYKLIPLGGGNNRSDLTTNFAEYAAEYNSIKKKYVFCYWPWLDDGKNKSIDDWKKNADEFNKLGKRYKSEGLKLAYHNHDIEFLETEKQIPYDIMLSYTDPELVTFQMDFWWIKKGGKNPLDYISNYPGRFEVCHIKTAGILSSNEEVPNLDYKNIISKTNKAGFKHFILENEPGIAEPFIYFQKSYEYLNTLF